MSTSINWGRLYAQGRCKAIGVSWSDAELMAVTKLGIPAEYVRIGILTKAEFLAKKDEVDKAKDPLMKKDKEELLKLAHQKGLNATSDADKETLVRLLGGDSVTKAAVKKAEKAIETEAPVEEVVVEEPVMAEKPKKVTKKAN